MSRVKGDSLLGVYVSFRIFHDWELEGMVSFFALIHSHLPIDKGVDKMLWKRGRCGQYEVKTFYETLIGSFRTSWE